MFQDKKEIIIDSKRFDYKTFEYLLNHFKEAFSHSSLTIESAFRDLKILEQELSTLKNEDSHNIYETLSNTEKMKVREIAKQIIVFNGIQTGMIVEPFEKNQKQVNRLYKEYFTDFDSYIPYFIIFDENRKLDNRKTFATLNNLFNKLFRRNNAYNIAYNMKKDNLDAFDYAMDLKDINIPEIIKINSIVVRSDPDKVIGFKKTNNDILTANFTPTDKELVPYEIQVLLSEYEKGFGTEILDPEEKGISEEEHNFRTYNIFRREAIFHIRFERIHPFNDGNGRTGRIILNHNLLNQGCAPVLITDVMSSYYKKCINTFDIDGLASMLLTSSSQQMTNWVSFNKGDISLSKREINPQNEKLAEISDMPREEQRILKRKL